MASAAELDTFISEQRAQLNRERMHLDSINNERYDTLVLSHLREEIQREGQ